MAQLSVHAGLDARVVHGGSGDLFGHLAGAPLELFPDARLSWLARTHFAQLYPFAGIPLGYRYELNHSPEGLDSFFVISLARALPQMSDAERVRILAASGVDVLLLDRELDPEAWPLAHRTAHYPADREHGSPLDLHVYELKRPTAEVQWVETVVRAPNLNDALGTLTSPEFDPQSMVALPSDPTPSDGARHVLESTKDDAEGGARHVINGARHVLEVLKDTPEEIIVRTRSLQSGVLTTRRAYLGIYRASVDGEPVPTRVANLHKLAVEVPAGDHEVRLWIDRRAYRWTRLIALVALVALVTRLRPRAGRGG